MQAHSIRVDLDGVPKKRRLKTNRHKAMVALPRAKKGDPLVCSPGGVAKADTSSSPHQMKLTRAMRSVTYRIIRTVQRLKGDTW